MIHKIEGKLTVDWNEDAKAIVDTWENYFISLDEFKEAVLVKGINHAKANGGIAWIVDSSKAKGAFSQDIQDFIDKELFPVFVKNGIKYFITVNSNLSAITRMTVSSYKANTEKNGLKLVEVQNVQEAIEWLKLQK